MLSAYRFEKINGHVPKTVMLKGQWRAWCNCDCGTLPVTLVSDGWFESESRALESLLDEVLREHGRICMERAGWKCERCESIHNLSAHHKEFRSHGRDDRVENLECLDLPCHEGAHKRKSAVRPADNYEEMA